jgi:dTDP-4-dehydrorhamnose 3,5-epimerase
MTALVSPAIPGVSLTDLTGHFDERGVLTELYRQAESDAPPMLQWNFVRSAPGVLRGVHGHFRHWDYLIVLDGSATIGLKDLRPGSAAYNRSTMIEMRGNSLQALTIPPGVAHGFFFPEPAFHIYGVSSYWDKNDELGCRWNDPELGLDWPVQNPAISPRDAALPSLADFREQLQNSLQAPPVTAGSR